VRVEEAAGEHEHVLAPGALLTEIAPPKRSIRLAVIAWKPRGRSGIKRQRASATPAAQARHPIRTTIGLAVRATIELAIGPGVGVASTRGGWLIPFRHAACQAGWRLESAFQTFG